MQRSQEWVNLIPGISKSLIRCALLRDNILLLSNTSSENAMTRAFITVNFMKNISACQTATSLTADKTDLKHPLEASLPITLGNKPAKSYSTSMLWSKEFVNRGNWQPLGWLQPRWRWTKLSGISMRKVFPKTSEKLLKSHYSNLNASLKSTPAPAPNVEPHLSCLSKRTETNVLLE